MCKLAADAIHIERHIQINVSAFSLSLFDFFPLLVASTGFFIVILIRDCHVPMQRTNLKKHTHTHTHQKWLHANLRNCSSVNILILCVPIHLFSEITSYLLKRWLAAWLAAAGSWLMPPLLLLVVVGDGGDGVVIAKSLYTIFRFANIDRMPLSLLLEQKLHEPN